MITTLVGSNAFLLEGDLQKQTLEFIKQYGDLALERVDGEEASYEQLQGTAESSPFLSDRKMVILRSPSSNKQFVDQFESWIERVADTSNVFIVEPKVDKRLSYYKQLKKHTNLIDYSEVDTIKLPYWLVEVAEKLGGRLSSTDSRYLVERVGANQQLLHNELEKLITYSPDVTKQTINLLTEQTPQSTVFQLMDAAFSGNLKRTLEIYAEQRRQKVEPLAIMGMIAWQLHAISIVKTAPSKPISEIAKDAKLNPFVLQKSQSVARRISLAELRKLVRQVADLDIKLKSTSVDADEAMNQLLIDIAGI